VRYGERDKYKDGDEEFRVEDDGERSEGDEDIEDEERPTKRRRARSIHTLAFD